jgi:hypothetical protein
MQLLDDAAGADAPPPEKRRLASLALGFMRYTQAATRSLEKRQAARRKDDMDFPAYVAGIRRSMEEQLEAFKRDWAGAHPKPAAPADAPRHGPEAGAAPEGRENPMHREAAPAARAEAAPVASAPPQASPAQPHADRRQNPVHRETAPAIRAEAAPVASVPPQASPAQPHADRRQNPMHRETAPAEPGSGRSAPPGRSAPSAPPPPSAPLSRDGEKHLMHQEAMRMALEEMALWPGAARRAASPSAADRAAPAPAPALRGERQDPMHRETAAGAPAAPGSAEAGEKNTGASGQGGPAQRRAA